MCRKVGAIYTGIFAKKSTRPTKWIGLDHSKDNWPEMELAKHIFKSDPELRINTLDGIKSAVEQTGWVGQVYHETRRHDTALRYVCDWIIQVFQNSQFKQSGTSSTEPEYCI